MLLVVLLGEQLSLGQEERRNTQGEVETGGSQLAPASVRRLRIALHAKATGDPDFRFCTLSDMVWSEDVMVAAWQGVHRNGGLAGRRGRRSSPSRIKACTGGREN